MTIITQDAVDANDICRLIGKHLFTMKHIVQKNILTIAGAFAGAAAGFLYYKFVGCISGECSITSNPYISTLYFSISAQYYSVFSKRKKLETRYD